ncbi:glycoside hydrolase family 5 protein [Paenibacillus typhae]|uniref:Aryl-phospho-beta-D-glucosidase BglC, GH1 family n=1 Tax=Paenibacillus typhae TaxID=1174501 RepID=A0A1G8V986_9BACL|nr:cellulase family glycosylhydrolase [Paenibacillus typhae]SDJ61885.1 Aryl-phospho-beta-D-glucosidase BglC, GH1 family [Paenibacillus typhae]
MKEWIGYSRGINLGGWLSQCPYQQAHYDSFITEKDIEMIASWGLDHVRLPVDYEVIEEPGDTEAYAGFKHIDNCIRWCADNGLNLIIDLHKTPGFSFDSVAANSLFDDPALQLRFLHLWKAISSRYASYKDTVAFELLNEIVEKDSSRWNALARRTVAEIRKYAPETKIVVGGIQWNSVHTLGLLDQPYDENIVYTFHFYEPFLFTHQRAAWVEQMPKSRMEYPGDLETYRSTSAAIGAFGSGLHAEGISGMGPAYMTSLIRNAIDVAAERNVYLYCGEYGVIEQAPAQSVVNWYRDVHDIFEQYKIGRAAWTYKQMDFGISDRYDSSITPEIISYL